jgi:hypothetical protein
MAVNSRFGTKNSDFDLTGTPGSFATVSIFGSFVLTALKVMTYIFFGSFAPSRRTLPLPPVTLTL